MKKANHYTPKQFKTNNFGNNFITAESFLSADFKNQTEEHFKECLKQVPTINNLLIARDKCDSVEHYEQVKAFADICFSLAMIERRIGIVNNEGSN